MLDLIFGKKGEEILATVMTKEDTENIVTNIIDYIQINVCPKLTLEERIELLKSTVVNMEELIKECYLGGK